MRIFGIFKKKPEEIILTREVLVEKWDENGIQASESLRVIIKTKIIPLLVAAMRNSGFSSVNLIDVEHTVYPENWELNDLLHKRILSGKYAEHYEYAGSINDFRSYEKWASRGRKMLEMVGTIKQQVEDMKKKRDELNSMLEMYTKNKK